MVRSLRSVLVGDLVPLPLQVQVDGELVEGFVGEVLQPFALLLHPHPLPLLQVPHFLVVDDAPYLLLDLHVLLLLLVHYFLDVLINLLLLGLLALQALDCLPPVHCLVRGRVVVVLAPAHQIQLSLVLLLELLEVFFLNCILEQELYCLDVVVNWHFFFSFL